jgi:hypothetical protein
MKDQFVTYEIAKRLKELGLNEPCLGFFRKNGEFYIVGEAKDGINMLMAKNEELTILIAAPLWQQAIDWLRVEHSVIICFNVFTNTPLTHDVSIYSHKDQIALDKSVFVDFNEAREAAILKALELIK